MTLKACYSVAKESTATQRLDGQRERERKIDTQKERRRGGGREGAIPRSRSKCVRLPPLKSGKYLYPIEYFTAAVCICESLLHAPRMKLAHCALDGVDAVLKSCQLKPPWSTIAFWQAS